MIRQEQCDKVCRILDDVLANRPTERDSLIVAVRKAFDALKKQRWIPVKAHPATDEEQESSPDIDYWFDCELPDDGQEILVTVKHKDWIGVEKDVCYVDSCYSLDSGYDWLDDIVAWMPLLEPWKGEEDETD